MAYDCYSDEEVRLQRKLIPLNIVVCIVCMVAILSLIFTPLFKFNAKKMGNEMIEILYKDGDLQENGVSAKEVLESFDGEISYNLIDIGKFAFSDNISLEEIVNSLFIRTGVIESASSTIANAVAVRELTGWDVDTNALKDIEKKFAAFGKVHSETEMIIAAGEWADTVNEYFPGSIDTQKKIAFQQKLAGYYNDTVKATGGPYDLEKFLCVAGSDYLGFKEPYTSYSEILTKVLDRNGTINQKLNEWEDAVKMVPKAIFWCVMSTVFVWALLFVFVFAHIFSQNKRFTMWYVKLWGIIPCLLFAIVPLVMSALFKTAGGALALLSAIFGATSSLTWISGGCWTLLWLISIFWAFPIKRRIRKERKKYF